MPNNPPSDLVVNFLVFQTPDLVQVYVSIQSSGKPIEHFLAVDQFLSLHFIKLLLVEHCDCFIVYYYGKDQLELLNQEHSTAIKK